MKFKPHFQRAVEAGVALSLISTLILAGCGGGGSGGGTTSSSNSTASTLTVTPMKGQFSSGAHVNVKSTSNLNVVIASGVVDTNGSAKITIPAGSVGPFLIEAGEAGDSYFDESTGSPATVPVGTAALRALIPNASASAVGVTALTEFAVGQIVAGSGIAAATATTVVAANTAIGSQFGVADPTAAPTVIGSTTSGTLAGGNDADDYALKLAGIAKMAKSGKSALDVIKDLRDDIADGNLDGRNGATPLTALAINTSNGLTLTQLNSELSTQVQAATTAYGANTANAPTVTLTVTALNSLLNSAVTVINTFNNAASGSSLSATTQYTQMVTTLQTQMASIAQTAGNNGGGAQAITDATATAVTATTTAATVLKTASKRFLSAWQAGFYNVKGVLSQGVWSTNVTKETSSGSYPNMFDNWEVFDSLNGAWNLQAGPVASSAVDGFYQLSQRTNGWRKQELTSSATTTTLTPVVLTDHQNGMFTWIDDSYGVSFTFIPTEIVLDGQPLKECAPNCPVNSVYPSGSIRHAFGNPVNNLDKYNVTITSNIGNVGYEAFATNALGVALTSLPTLGTDFCVSGQLYHALPNPATVADNYQIIVPTGGCTQGAIAAAVAANPTGSTVRIVNKSTGIAQQTVLRIVPVTGGATLGQSDSIFALVQGKVWSGFFSAKGFTPDLTYYIGDLNKIAADAEVAAMGLPAVP